MFRLFCMLIYLGIGLSFTKPGMTTMEKSVTAIGWPLYIGLDIGRYIQR